MCVRATGVCVSVAARRGCQFGQSWSFKQLCHLTKVLGLELESSVKAAGALTHRASSSSACYFKLKQKPRPQNTGAWRYRVAV